MKLMLDIDIPAPLQKITYNDSLFVIGSCFTEHIGRRLEELKFPVLQNPNGILFDPLSVSNSLLSYINKRRYTHDDLFFLNELWQSWSHHSQFSGLEAVEVLKNINESQQKAHDHLAKATWLIITLGSSFSYQLTENRQPVANCHRAPGQWFNKHLLSIEETVQAMNQVIEHMQEFNPACNIIFTISPVRHIRDGVVENNRSKARLLEAVHSLADRYNHVYYFPAYELVIDVLRDYRFYDVDLVHPNYAATEIVFDRFEQAYIDEDTRLLMADVRKIVTGYKHKPFQPDTLAHQQFLQSQLDKVHEIQKRVPQLDFTRELLYFSRGTRSH